MRIEFDPTNHTETAIVAALLANLHGGGSVTATLSARGAELAGASDFVAPAPAPVADEPQADPAAAFGAPSPEQAFAPPPGNAAPAAAPAPSGGDGAGNASPSAPDKEGLPWDARIHSKPATMTAKGVWRAKRNLDDATKAAVSAELRQALAAPAPIPTSATGAPPAETADEAAARAVAHLGGAVPLPPAAPAVTPPAPPAPPPSTPAPAAPPPTPAAAVTAPPSPAAGPVTSFADLMRKITGMQTAGTLTVEQTGQISQSLGLSGIRDLMLRPDLIPSFDALLPAVG